MVKQHFFYFLVFNFLLVNSWGFAQKDVDSVVKLSEFINSEAEEILPLLSQSGDSLFFARVFHEDNIGGKYSGSDIWLSIFDDDTQSWGKASNQLNKWNDKRNNFIVGINSKEHIIYQNNPKNPEKGIRFIKKISTYWTKPENISLPGIPKTGYQGLYVNSDYSIILLAMKSDDGYGQEDLYVSTKNDQGDWSLPLNLGSTINTSESEISPFLSADKKTLYFSSKGHAGYGDMDIFMAERLYNSWTVWTKPKNLGAKINSSAFDGYYSEYGDSIAFFSSNRESELSEIYQARINSFSYKNRSKSKDLDNENKLNYLTEKDLIEYFGFIFNQNINFIDDSALITEQSQELLYFIANKINEIKVIKIELICINTDKNLRIERLNSVNVYLQNLNVSAEKIVMNSKKLEDRTSGFKVNFFKSTEIE